MKRSPSEFRVTPVDQLREHPGNPNIGHTDAIMESILDNGWFGAVIAQRSTGYILAGNHRFRVAVSAGATELPVFWLDVDDRAASKIMLADNRVSDLGGYNRETLGALLESLADSEAGLDGTGYTRRDLDELVQQVASDRPRSAEYCILVHFDNPVARDEYMATLTAEGFACKPVDPRKPRKRQNSST